MADEPVRREMGSDEIDIGALIARVWATRGRMLIALLTVAAAFAALLATRYLIGDKVVTYRQAFDLAFEGLNDGQFPDGSPFLVNDIIGSTVLGMVHRENNLAEQGISLDGFRRAVNIEPYAPDYFIIQQRYRQQLSNRDLEATAIAEIQDRMRQELSAATGSSVQISLRLPIGAITKEQAREVLKDIPQAWAQRAIEEKGVLKLNLPLYTARIFNEQRFQDLDYLVAIELLLKNIDLIQQNIASLEKEPNAVNAVDDETGYTLVDLQKAIQDVADYDLRLLVDPVKELGLARDPGFVKLLYQSRLQDLRLQKHLWKERADVTRQVFNSYSGGAEDGAGESVSIATIQNNLAPQLGDVFLDRLLAVSSQGDNLAYRQELTKQILIYENNALDADHEIAEIQFTLDSLDQTRGDRGQYIENVQSHLPRFLSTLRDYAEIVDRLHEKLSRQAVGTTSELIQPQGGSFQEMTDKPVTSKDVKILIALLVLTLFGAIFISLVVDLYRERKVSETDAST